MTSVEILGWVAAAAGAALSIPQVVRLLRAGTSAGLSLLMWQLLQGVGLGWTYHGWVVQRPNVWVPNLVMAAFAVLVVRLVIKDRKINHLRAWSLPVALTVLLIVVNLIWGAVGFGAVVSIPQVIGMGAQLVEIIRRIDIRGISLEFLAFSVVVQGLWWAWSLLAGESAVLISATCAGSVALVSLVWHLLRRSGLVRAMAGPGPSEVLQNADNEAPPASV